MTSQKVNLYTETIKLYCIVLCFRADILCFSCVRLRMSESSLHSAFWISTKVVACGKLACDLLLRRHWRCRMGRETGLSLPVTLMGQWILNTVYSYHKKCPVRDLHVVYYYWYWCSLLSLFKDYLSAWLRVYVCMRVSACGGWGGAGGVGGWAGLIRCVVSQYYPQFVFSPLHNNFIYIYMLFCPLDLRIRLLDVSSCRIFFCPVCMCFQTINKYKKRGKL